MCISKSRYNQAKEYNEHWIQFAVHVTRQVSLAVGAVAAATSLKSCKVTEVVLNAPVCWMMKFVVEIALT